MSGRLFSFAESPSRSLRIARSPSLGIVIFFSFALGPCRGHYSKLYGIMSNGADWCPLREGLSWVPVFNDRTNVMVMAMSGLGCAILILARAGLSLQDNHVVLHSHYLMSLL